MPRYPQSPSLLQEYLTKTVVNILGIETSCDETSAAVVSDGELLSNIISSQYFHSEYGGIVPELASRAHLRTIIPIIEQALKQAGLDYGSVTHVAATQGPGLIGSLLVGLNTAKAIALALDVPFLPVHHIEAHMYSTHLMQDHPEYPFLSLIVSGGHTLVVKVESLGNYRILGSTIDDAAGEAFDKVAKMLGLGFPGGPEIDRRAKLGNPDSVHFPRPKCGSNDPDFSFSGLKTSVLYHVRKRMREQDSENPRLPDQVLNDICASFQRAVIDVLKEKIFRAAESQGICDIGLAGGVSANSELRATLSSEGKKRGMRIFLTHAEFTTDIAAMIALLAHMKLSAGISGNLQSPAFARIPRSESNAFT